MPLLLLHSININTHPFLPILLEKGRKNTGEIKNTRRTAISTDAAVPIIDQAKTLQVKLEIMATSSKYFIFMIYFNCIMKLNFFYNSVHTLAPDNTLLPTDMSTDTASKQADEIIVIDQDDISKIN